MEIMTVLMVVVVLACIVWVTARRRSKKGPGGHAGGDGKTDPGPDHRI